MRQKVKRIVIACPASVITQWQSEMEVRFGLTFVILDREYVIHCRRERGYGINPWKTHSRFIISHSLLRDEQYGEPLRDWLQENRSGSMLVLDEAHHAAPATSSCYAVDSQFTRAMRDLTGLFEHRLFLSATPHNGHSNSFSALLEMLDPQRFFRGEKVTNPKLLDEVMVRRLKDELRELVPNLGLPKRVVMQHDISGLPDDAPELTLMRLLNEYRDLREQLRRHDQLPHSFITRPLPSIENGRHVERFTLITECTQPDLQRPRSAVAGNVPAMGPPLPFNGISRVGNANCASLMERLPGWRRTFNSREFLVSAHPRLM